MKRFIILIISALGALGSLYAQNANRNGFFLELGIGGMVGDNVRTAIVTKDNVVYNKFLSGTAGDFGFGFRKKLGRHWSYEFKVEGMFPFEDVINNLTGRLLPVGFRYTSVELWRNYSLYTHFNIGGVVTANNGEIYYGSIEDETIYPNGEFKIKGYKDDPGFGASYSLGVGANITTHLYAEACWNGNLLFNGTGMNGKGMLNGGAVGLIIGYRF